MGDGAWFYRRLQFISQVVNGLRFCAGQASSSPSDSVNCFNMDLAL